MIREGQFTPEIRDYLNSLPPWKDSEPGRGWMVNQFYTDTYELRRKNIDKLPDNPTAEQMAGYLVCKYECENITLEEAHIVGMIFSDLYEYWNTHDHMMIPEEVVDECIAKHAEDILPSPDYIELDDILL